VAEARLITLAGCGLVIGGYPRFRYNALGGQALGEVAQAGQDLKRVQFPANTIRIPDLNWRTTRFLGLPLPPGLKIGIQPEQLAGQIQTSTGQVELQFRSRFRFCMGASAGLQLSAPDLGVETRLTTEAISSQRHNVQGQRLDQNNRGVLVGTARIEPCGAAWLDRFLGLPDEALAVLECRFEI
jgi:hypothetical protein